ILVQHASLGVGKVVALEPDAVHVFFPSAEKRFATKLRLPAARAFLRTDGVAPDAWLQGLTAFTLDGETRRYALAASWLTHEQATAQFVAAYPQGFGDPRYLSAKEKGARAARWRAAHDAWVKALGGGEAERLLQDDDVGEIVKRVLAVERQMAPLWTEEEASALAEALQDGPETRAFLERLVELLSVPSPTRARFDKLFAAAMALPGDPELAWIIATLLPFVAEPGRHVLVRPGTVRAAAAKLGCDLRWDDAPNWATYAALRALSAKLLDELKPLGARDLADVEAFLHLTATTRARPGAPEARSGVRRAKAAVAGAAVRERRQGPTAAPRRMR
ncbi:MAG TPA: hypothetical protein VIW03_16330, partial [Anaeromyxobacter sp.]